MCDDKVPVRSGRYSHQYPDTTGLSHWKPQYWWVCERGFQFLKGLATFLSPLELCPVHRKLEQGRGQVH